MNRIALAIVLGLSLLSPVYAAEETPPLRDVVDHVSPSVVGVIVELSEPAEPSKDQNQGSQVKTRDGTGMVFSSEGHIVTAVHVIEKAAKITVVFANNSRSMAQVGERTQRQESLCSRSQGCLILHPCILAMPILSGAAIPSSLSARRSAYEAPSLPESYRH